ncbi:MAG: hypothetical protein QM692_11175 [Thermomicrobiales bacterium]
MWKRMLGCAGMVAALALGPALALAQDATPTAGAQPANLTAMALFPADLPESGFALDSGRFEPSSGMAAAVAERTGKTGQETQADLDAFGYGRRYALRLAAAWPTGTPPPDGVDNPWGRTVTTIVTEFPSAEDATAAFTYIEKDAEAAGGLSFFPEEEDVPLDTVIGDEAELTSLVAIASDTGAPYASLNLTFRTGNLIADVTIDDYLNREIDQTDIEEFAGLLLTRIEEVRSGDMPDLGERMLRFAGPTYEDSYTRLDGVAFPEHGMTAKATAELQARSNAQAIYTRDQDIDGAAHPAYFTVQLLRFASPEDAAAFDVEALTQRFADDPFYSDVVSVTDAPTVGDASTTLQYGYAEDTDYADWSGYSIVARSGAELILLSVEQPGGASLETVVELAEMQLACVTGDPCPDVLPIPVSLLAPAATPVAAATPAA